MEWRPWRQHGDHSHGMSGPCGDNGDDGDNVGRTFGPRGQWGCGNHEITKNAITLK